jgi:hypothetical protein
MRRLSAICGKAISKRFRITNEALFSCAIIETESLLIEVTEKMERFTTKHRLLQCLWFLHALNPTKLEFAQPF